MPFTKNVNGLETSQLFCIANHLTGFCIYNMSSCWNPKHLNNLTERIKKIETQLQDQNKNDEVDRINKLETQLQDKNDEIEDLRNRSLRNNLIFTRRKQ